MAARAELPSGTVTFLFTDIEGSTKLLHELGERYAEVLAEHRRVLREAFGHQGGIEVDTQGDAFFYVFASAKEAITAASKAQAALASGLIRVRMGVHTGEPTRTEEGYVGVDVHRAARICAAGHGGQILVSDATRALLEGSELRDLGEHRLKDLSEPQRLYQIAETEFPPLKTLHQSNLPVPATPFLGRERELGEVLALLRSSRLLTGPGGSGKTRLAAQAAAEAAEDFPGGVWWVSLAALRDPALVLDSIAQVLGAKGELAEHIADQKLLLLLDNLEQLLPAAPGLATLLERCSGLRLLVTSREPLRIGAEQEYPVPTFVSEEAIDFFSARARAAKPDFRPDEAVAEVCRRLDNLPLALELAAARVKVLSPEDIRARLERALPLLTGGRRDAPERQQTLEATIAWSYDLLAEREQRLFARLSVFAGGCTLEAAEQVAEAELEMLASLVDKSLLRQREGRFWMLKTIREYAGERLEQPGEEKGLRQRHAAHFADVAARAEAAYPDFPIAQLQEERDNFRAALAWALGERSDLAVRLGIPLGLYWYLGGNSREGGAYIERILPLASTDLDRARLLHWAGGFASQRGEYREGLGLLKESVRLSRKTRNTLGLVYSLFALTATLGGLGAFSEATKHAEEAVAVARREDETALLALALRNLGATRVAMQQLDSAGTAFEEGLEAARSSADEMAESALLNELAILALVGGNAPRARQLGNEAVAIAADDFPLQRAHALLTLAATDVLDGNPDAVQEWCTEVLEVSDDLDDVEFLASVATVMAAAAAQRGERSSADNLSACASVLRPRPPIGIELVLLERFSLAAESPHGSSIAAAAKWIRTHLAEFAHRTR